MKVSPALRSGTNGTSISFGRSPAPTKTAAGSITPHSPMKPMIASSHPPRPIRAWAKGAAMNAPMEPAAATVPRIIERLNGEITLAVVRRRDRD